MGNVQSTRKQHLAKVNASRKKALLESELIEKRREKLTARARAIYDEAVGHGLAGTHSVRSVTILAQMAALSESEKHSLEELFHATNLKLETVLLTKNVNSGG